MSSFRRILVHNHQGPSTQQPSRSQTATTNPGIRRSFAGLLCVMVSLFALGFAGASASAQFVPIVSTTAPTATAVGGQSAPFAVTVTMTTAGTAATPSVLTQGIASADFQVATGGSCASGTAYSANQQCTVDVIFAPLYPGQRNGAVVVEDASGNVLGLTFVTGQANGSLSVLVPGRIDTIAGNGEWIYAGDNVAATLAPIFLPSGVVEDAAGNIFFSDTDNNRIRRIDGSSGLITTIAGTGNPGYSGDGGPATSATVSAPAGIVIDGAGNLYFADTGNDAVRRLDVSKGVANAVITTVAGIPTAQGYSGDGGAATAAKLSGPQGLGFDASQNLYIADTGNNVIRMVSSSDGTISTFAGTGVAGYSGDSHAAASAMLSSPWSVTPAPGGTIYIADLNNNVVRAVSSSGIISTIAGNATKGFSGDGGPATAASLNAPASVVFDPAGNLYVADSGNNRVRKIYTSGTIETLTGTNSEEFAGDAGAANLASLYGPYALDLDQAGNLLIVDIFHNRIRKISAGAMIYAFDPIHVGKISSNVQAEGLENDGNASMPLSSFALSNAALDADTTTCSTSSSSALAVDANCNLGIEFAPTTIGDPIFGSVSANSNAGNSPSVVTIYGQVLSVYPTSVTLASSSNPGLISTAITFTAGVSSSNPSSYSGTVTFYDNTTQLCEVNLSSTNTASCTVYTLGLGSHSITAAYSGDPEDASSVSSPALAQQIQQQASVLLTTSQNPIVFTNNLTLTATVTAPTGTPTGTVKFFDSGTLLGSATLSNGVATFSTNQLTAATHNLSAQYMGDALDAGTTSNTASEVVNLETTATTLSTNGATVYVGTQVIFTANVGNTNGSQAPSGTVNFLDNGTTIGSGTMSINNGNAVFATSSLTPGNHVISASYQSDGSCASSTSTPGLLETVQQLPTTTTIVSGTNPSFAGAPVQFTATVVMGPGVTADGSITGTVSFSEGSTVLGTATLGSNGQASISVSTLNAGNHNIIASYSGNTNYAPGSSTYLSQQVQTTTTTTVLTTSAQTILAGKPVTFNVAVTSSTAIPTGTVTILDGTAGIGQITINAQGTGSFTTSSLSVGTHNLTASYGGDGNYQPSVSGLTQETVNLATTGVTLAGPTTPVDAGTKLSLVATLSSNGVTPTGSITLHDGGTVIGTQTVTGTGAFSFSTTSLSVGTHALTAVYSGDVDNATATSAVVSVVIQQAPTTTTLTTSANPSVAGQSLTLSSAVTSDSPSISGSINFMDGGTLLSSVPVVNGAATYTTTTLTAGSHSLTAVYAGDTNHATSTSAATSELIVQTDTANVTSNNNPSISGTNVVFTAKIGGNGTTVPTGTVVFTDGGTTIGTVTLDATGAASLQISTLSVGSHTIVASYGGDKNYSAASASTQQIVQNASTQVSLTSSANPGIYGTPLSLAVVITSDGGVATGSVTFTDNGTSIGTATLNATGQAVLSTNSLAPGNHSIIANYAGDGKASASISTPLSLVVKEVTSVALVSSANPTSTLSPVTFTAAVTNAGVGVATGAVTFTDGSAQLGVVTLDGTGHASLTVPQLSAGNHTIQASYAGDGDNFSSSSSTLTQGIQLRATTTQLTASQTNASDPLQVTLIGVVHWTGPVTPTGTVTFAFGNTTIGTIPVDETGVATITIELQANTESITATYNGDAAYAGSQSLATTVTGGPATQFTMSMNPPSVTLVSKQRTIVTLSFSSVKDFTDKLEFGCLGLPYAATCTFSGQQVTLAANGTTNVQLTIDTGDPLGSGAQAANHSLIRSNVMLCFLPGSLLAGMVFLRKRRKTLVSLVLLLCAAFATAGITGCSGLQTSGTPAGSYTFKISATGVGTGATVSQNMALTVTQ